MATQSWSTPINHTSDAGFRAWGDELHAKLAAAGLAQTEDTGQIDWSTVNRPAANTVAGFEIWRFADSLAGTAPIYLELEYGTGGNNEIPSMFCTCGTGSNGTGTLIGQKSDRLEITPNANITSVATPYPSYLCVTEGFFGLILKAGACSNFHRTQGTCFVARNTNGAGAMIDTGYTVLAYDTQYAGPPTSQSVRTAAPPASYAKSTSYCVVPGAVVNSDDGEGNKQVYIHWTLDPKVRPCHGVCTVLDSELPTSTIFSAVLVGSTPHDFISLASHTYGEAKANASYGMAMLWE